MLMNYSISLRQERYKRRCADVARCWGRYCLLLMQVSVDRAIPDDPQDEPREPQEPEEESVDRQVLIQECLFHILWGFVCLDDPDVELIQVEKGFYFLDKAFFFTWSWIIMVTKN